MVSTVIPVQPFDLVIFGATGDLSHRKILPSLFRRMAVHQMPSGSRIIGAARSKMTRVEFRKTVREALAQFVEAKWQKPELVEEFINSIDYVAIDATGEAGWAGLAKRLDERPNHIRAFYLSVAPSLFAPIAGRLAQAGIATPESRIVVEKPLGHDLASAKALNAELRKHFAEDQIYRIDHYLGKETVQNLMAIRFANALFEPLWNSHYVEQVQITVAEVARGRRPRGLLRPVGRHARHGAEPHDAAPLPDRDGAAVQVRPRRGARREAEGDPRARSAEAFGHGARAIPGQRQGRQLPRPRRQSGEPDRELRRPARPYCQLAVVGDALLHAHRQEARGADERDICVVFKHPPHTIFPQVDTLRGNALIIRLQPNEGITLRVAIKDPGPGGMRLVEVPLDMTFASTLGPDGAMPEAYERLIMDVIRGNQTLFMRGDEVEAAWEWADPIVAAWEDSGSRPLLYDPGSAGPIDSYKLTGGDGHLWREIAV